MRRRSRRSCSGRCTFCSRCWTSARRSRRCVSSAAEEGERVAAEAEYRMQKQPVVDELVVFLKMGDALGKDQMLVAAEFMAEFQQAAQRAQDEQEVVRGVR